MFITLDHTELLAILEGAAYRSITDNANNTEIKDAEKNGEYNLGYIDGVIELCEDLKANVKKYAREKEEQQKAAAAKRTDEIKAAEKESKPETSKYDN